MTSYFGLAPRVVTLLFVLTLWGCGEVEEKTNVTVTTPAGERMVRTAFEVITLSADQLKTAFEKMAPGKLHPVLLGVEPRLTGNSLPTGLKSGPARTGFNGPVSGPGGATLWYVQDITITNKAETKDGMQPIDSTLRLFLRATPSVDLSKVWPKKMLTLEVAVHGLSGIYDGYRQRLLVTAESSDKYNGTLEQWFEEPTDERSYAKYFIGSKFTATYSVAKDDAFEPDWSKAASTGSLRYHKTNESTVAQLLKYIDRQPIVASPVEAPPRLNPATFSWYTHWRRFDVLDQTTSFDNGTYTLKGPASYSVVLYWGQGDSDPLVFEEPAYTDSLLPRGDDFVTPNDLVGAGLLGWLGAKIEAGSDFAYRKGKKATDAAQVSGTCSGKVSLLPHDDKRCRLDVTDCTALPSKRTWVPDCK